MQKIFVVIIGVGEGLGFSLAKKFLAQNYQVIIIARNQKKLDDLINSLNHPSGLYAISADMSDEVQIVNAFQKIKQEYKLPEILIYNASATFTMKEIMEITPSDFLTAWKISCYGGLLSSQQVIPNMLENKKGTIIFTGATASLRGGIGTAAFAVGKFSQRALSQSMAKELGPKGIHVAHVLVDGFIATPNNIKQFSNRSLDTFLSPDAIADMYLYLCKQSPTAWTHELDLRPYTEKF